jgi:dTDP-4-amino-4,6-dideoxygalactose transaminase
VFSFHPVKIITTAEGGMAVTNKEELAKKMAIFRTHGISHDASDMHVRPLDEIWNYQQLSLGFNYRMTELQAALGLSQLKMLDQFVQTRQSIARFYDQALAALPLRTPWQHPDTLSSFHLYPIQTEISNSHQSQKDIYRQLIQSGIKVNLHYIPVYRHPYYESMGFRLGYCPNAEQYFKSCISIPLYSSMNEQQKQRVVGEIKRVLLKKLAGNDACK